MMNILMQEKIPLKIKRKKKLDAVFSMKKSRQKRIKNTMKEVDEM